MTSSILLYILIGYAILIWIAYFILSYIWYDPDYNNEMEPDDFLALSMLSLFWPVTIVIAIIFFLNDLYYHMSEKHPNNKFVQLLKRTITTPILFIIGLIKFLNPVHASRKLKNFRNKRNESIIPVPGYE